MKNPTGLSPAVRRMIERDLGRPLTDEEIAEMEPPVVSVFIGDEVIEVESTEEASYVLGGHNAQCINDLEACAAKLAELEAAPETERDVGYIEGLKRTIAHVVEGTKHGVLRRRSEYREQREMRTAMEHARRALMHQRMLADRARACRSVRTNRHARVQHRVGIARPVARRPASTADPDGSSSSPGVAALHRGRAA